MFKLKAMKTGSIKQSYELIIKGLHGVPCFQPSCFEQLVYSSNKMMLYKEVFFKKLFKNRFGQE